MFHLQWHWHDGVGGLLFNIFGPHYALGISMNYGTCQEMSSVQYTNGYYRSYGGCSGNSNLRPYCSELENTAEVEDNAPLTISACGTSATVKIGKSPMAVNGMDESEHVGNAQFMPVHHTNH